MQLFNFEGHNIRTVDINGNPHFVGVDVTRTLMYSNPSKAVIDHCKGVTKLGIPSDGGVQETNVIPESDVYRLIVKAADQSKNEVIRENAEKFEKHVFEVILPTIRKHGAFMTPETIERTLSDPDFIISLAGRLKQANEEKSQLQAKIESDRPKVVFAEALETSNDSILVADLAKLLKQNGIAIGEIRLFAWLRENGYLIKGGSEYNMPTQRSMELKIMEIKVGQRASASEGFKQTRTTKITGKGQMYFINKFISIQNKPA